jgi:hypothetical protein
VGLIIRKGAKRSLELNKGNDTVLEFRCIVYYMNLVFSKLTF